MDYKKDLYTSYMKIPNIVLHSDTFLKFSSRPCFGLYLRLSGYIVRSRNIKYKEFDLYETHYKKGYLSTSWSQRKLAKSVGCSRSSIIRRIKELHDEKAIEIEKVVRGDKTYNIYTLGTWETKSENGYIFKNEHFYLINKFIKIALEETNNKYISATPGVKIDTWGGVKIDTP